jgi:multidrug efflux pump subunit AcrA (membrane-fusion protein)
MSTSIEPTANPELPASGKSPANGFTPLNPLGEGTNHKSLPSRGRRKNKLLLPLALASTLAVGAAAFGGWYYYLRPTPVRADVLLHTVKREVLVVTVAEKGTLESADNRDIVCKVRAGSKGFASTINWVIDDGSRVKPGQLLMILDDSALKDQEEDQHIKLQTAFANKVKAEKDYEIAVKQNTIAVETAKNVLALAEIELEKFTGLNYDPRRGPLAALGGGMSTLTEAGSFQQEVDNVTGEVRQYESDVEQNRERFGWAERMVKSSYMSPAQAQAERSRLDSSIEKLRSSKAKLAQLLTYDRKQRLTDLTSKRDNAQRALEQAELEADAKLEQARTEKQTKTSIYLQEEEKLRDIIKQRNECKIVAPPNIQDNSMVVYFKQESNRFSGSTQGMIEQGAQVKEGQKLLRIPNLSYMQVNTKVHEAMVARIRGDVRVQTYLVDTVQKVKLLNPDLFSKIVGQQQESADYIRERLRNYEYKKLADGQRARIRVDALPDRTFEGHVRTVAAVASQADSWISDVKLYQTLVVIDAEVLADGTRKPITSEQLKPDMTAEVTITVDTAKDPVLTVPVQAIIGSTELGGKRDVFVKTETGYERRPVKLGISNEKVVEVQEGLSEGDEVVMNPRVLLGDDKTTKTRDGEKGGSPGGGNKGGGDSPKGSGAPGVPGGGGGKKKGAGPPPGT